MNNNGQLDFLDFISIASFVIALENLDLNATQEDAQNLQKALSEKTDLLLREVHRHLEEQDIKLSDIQKQLEELRNDR